MSNDIDNYIKTVAIQSLFFYIWLMIARWCISILIFTLTVFGVVSQQHIVVPNQEIVLQFSDVALTSQDAKNTIASVKAQLLDLGVKNIKVKAQHHGKLKISYYSDADIAIIKRNFAKTNNLVLDYTSENQDEYPENFPLEDYNISYNLDVYEIQQHNNSGWDFDGAFVLNVEFKSDRFSDPNIYFSVHDLDFKITNSSVKVAYKSLRNSTEKIGEVLHSKPEVRAGPNC